MTTKMVNRRQACWAQTLATTKFTITYRSGPHKRKPYRLTRRSGHLPGMGDDRLTQQSQVVVPPSVLNLSALHISPKFNFKNVFNPQCKELLPRTPFLDDMALAYNSGAINHIRNAQSLDPLMAQLVKDIAAHKSHYHFLSICECQVQDGLLYYQCLLDIPDNAGLKLAVL